MNISEFKLKKLLLLSLLTAGALQFAKAQGITTYTAPPVAFVETTVRTQCEYDIYRKKLYDAAKDGHLLNDEQKRILRDYYNGLSVNFDGRNAILKNYKGRDYKYPLPTNYNNTYHQLITKECKGSTSKTSGSTGGSGSSSSDTYNGGGSSGSQAAPYSDDEVYAAAALIVVAAVVATAAAIVVVSVSNDVYFHKTESAFYNGYNLGLKNSMNSHIDIEYGASFNKAGSGYIGLNSLKSDYIGWTDKTLWTLDFNAVYNIRNRDRYKPPIFNPYLGYGMSFFINDNERKGRQIFGFGGMAGFSFGRRVQLHCRYKWLNNFQNDIVPMNQFEIGLSIKYYDGLLLNKIFSN